MINRRLFTASLGATLFASTGARLTFAQSIEDIASDPLREQVEWFVGLLSDPEQSLDEQEVASHFTDQFLDQVPADQVIATVEQIRPSLGDVTVGKIASGTDDVQAGVQIIGSSGIQLLLTIWIAPDSGLIEGMLLEPYAAASPMASPMASPIAADAPPSTGDILDDWSRAQEFLAEAARPAVDAFLNGDTQVLLEMVAPEFRTQFEAMALEDVIAGLTTNMVTFAIEEVNAWFFGHYTPDLIAGQFHQGTPGTFSLTPEETQNVDVPTGMWTGAISVPGANIGIEVTFAGTADDLSATISIPEQTLMNAELQQVSFEAERPIGEQVAERSLPTGPKTQHYGVLHTWGNAGLSINVALNGEGDVIGVSALPQPPLGDDPAQSTVPVSHAPGHGAWLAYWAGDTEFSNYHATTPPQRHAMDLLIWRDGATYADDGTKVEQYHCYGQEILAPVDGTVIEVADGVDDTLIGEPAAPGTHPAGNYVVIETAEGAYIWLAHLIPGSIRVLVDSAVEAGQVMGLVGNSGNSSEPHIHMHAQSVPGFHDPAAIGLPIVFENVLINDEPTQDASLTQGQILETAP